jgi:Ca-activated chloride channel family protein
MSRLKIILLIASIALLVSASLLVSGCRSVRSAGMTPLPGSAFLRTGDFQAANPAASPETSLATLSELWIVVRENHTAAREVSEGLGALLALQGTKEVPLPLKRTEIKANVIGSLASVQVAQRFQNPYSRKIEAVYVFPLPHDAAVTDFIMTIGERKIRGIVRERKEAETLYAAAKAQGHVASLLTEERPNVFTEKVGNIEPGHEILVQTTYFNALTCNDSWFELAIPTVVGPRYNPEGSSDGIGAVRRGETGASGQLNEVEYLRAGETAAATLGISVDLNAGVKLEALECNTHRIEEKEINDEHKLITLAHSAEIANRDFVLRYRLTGGQVKSSLLTQRDERGGHFLLSLYPPQELSALPRQPMEMVFVLDCSGSMNGEPIAHAKRALRRGLELLEPEDTFQLITFSLRASTFGRNPLPATRENIEDAMRYLDTLNGEGGTEMLEGVHVALNFPHDSSRLRFVCFLTDGYIGNETEIFRAVQKELGSSRIFSFGIGSSVNRYLLAGLASIGKGAATFLGPHDDAAEIMETFFDRISHPALTDVRIDWGNLSPLETYPRRLPDLFTGRPILVTGRFAAQRPEAIAVTGKMGGDSVGIEVPILSNVEEAKLLPQLWARMKIAALEEESAFRHGGSVVNEIKTTALDYNLTSPYTAFAAVDATQRTAGGNSVAVPVAVPVPEGVDSETSIKEQ